MVFGAAFAETLDNTGNLYESRFATPTIERLVFRTGDCRMKDFSRYDADEDDGDLPDPDKPVDEAVFNIDNVKTTAIDE